jgi:hypothetical protein
MCSAICRRSGVGRFLVAEVQAIEHEHKLDLESLQQLYVVVKDLLQAVWKATKGMQEWLTAGLVESKVQVV